MSYRAIKWTLFLLLLLFAPAPLILFVVFMSIPPVFFAGAIFYMIPKTLVPAHASETLAFIGNFAVQLLIAAGVFLLIALILARLIFLLRQPLGRHLAFAAMGLSIASLSFFPLYGSGGHGPTDWHSLFAVFEEVNRDYGPFAVVTLYGVVLIAVAVFLLMSRRRGKKSLRDQRGE